MSNREEKSVNMLTNKNIRFLSLLLLILVAFRFYDLSLRPVHHDEGVNSWFVDQIWQNGFYRFDPTNYHGPTLFYLGLVSKNMFGDNLWSMRAVSVIASVLTLLLLLLERRRFGDFTLYAALAMAVSTGYYYFSRYYFHEPLLILGLVVGNLGLLRLFQGDRRGWLWLWVGGLWGFATKEPVAIHTIGIFVAIVSLTFTQEGREWMKQELAMIRQTPSSRWLPFVICGLIAFFALYTGFLYNPQGAIDFFKAFLPWLNTGVSGNGHEKPWYYWLELLQKYEWHWLVGSVAAIYFAIKGKTLAERFISVQALATFAIYSLVPYKTPWCVISLSFLFSFTLAFAVVEFAKHHKKLALGVFAVLLGAQFYLMYDFNFNRYADMTGEPYVYVQTTKDYGRILSLLEEIEDRDSSVRNVPIESALVSHWPLPWALRRFTHLNWTLTNLNPNADLILADKSKVGNLFAQLNPNSRYMVFIARGGVESSYFIMSEAFARRFKVEEFFNALSPVTEVRP